MANSSRQSTRLPAWARMLGQDDFRAFMAEVRRYFDRRHIVFELDEDKGIVRPALAKSHVSSAFGLQNLLQQCAQADHHTWPALVLEHFDAILDARDDQNALNVDMSRLSKVVSQLRARIYPADVSAYFGELVSRPGPDGTLEVLVLDLPMSVRTVARDEAAKWGIGEPELLEIGRRNLELNSELSERNVALPVGAVVTLCTGDSYYGASHVLLIERYLAGDTGHGALVAIPRRDVMLIHIIRDVGALDALSAMCQVVYGMHRDGPGSISPHVYWYHSGRFEALPYVVEDTDLRVTPTPEFSELLDTLEDSVNLS